MQITFSPPGSEAARLREVCRPGQGVRRGLEGSAWTPCRERRGGEEWACAAALYPGSEHSHDDGLVGTHANITACLGPVKTSRAPLCANGRPYANVSTPLLSFCVAEPLKLYLEFALQQTLNNAVFLQVLRGFLCHNNNFTM